MSQINERRVNLDRKRHSCAALPDMRTHAQEVLASKARRIATHQLMPRTQAFSEKPWAISQMEISL